MTSPPELPIYYFSFYFNMFFPISYFPNIFLFYKLPFLCYILSISLSLKYSMYFFTITFWRSKIVERKVPFHGFLIFFENLQVSSQYRPTFIAGIAKPLKPRWLSMNTVTIEMHFHGKITVKLVDFVDRDWFSTVLRGGNFYSNSRIRW